ncbi:OsmC family protein [Halocatena pleomorpha]|uniref:OsmC family peroxiredoxin n=1 Tax=Halocatena pleomorpha TaxID=1785090 RepID=A0A3P3RET9_9EURY|nr:OsmC family protein [Halocatena pleomorpha]RRJ31439.1 OsmC family peroxiredoxin [Halocatena pleomorpha]
MLESTTTSKNGYETVTRLNNTDLIIDAGSETEPSPTETLLASYAACYTVALRIGTQQQDVDTLGRVEINAEADRDTENDLEAIRFAVAVESDLDAETLAAIVERANDLCHVHDALRKELHADVTIRGNAV